MKAIMIGILLLMLCLTHAQVKIIINSNENSMEYSKLQKMTEKYTDKIDSLVEAEKNLMKQEIQAVNTQWENEELTEGEAEAEKEMISDKYATKIEEGVAQLQSELENIIDEQVKISLYDLDDDTFIEADIEVVKNKNAFKKTSQMIWTATLGFSNLTRGWNLGSMNDSDFNFGKSIAFTTGPMLQYQPTNTSPFLLQTGLQFKTNNFRANGLQYFNENQTDGVTLSPSPYTRQRKAKLRTNSLYIPIGFKYSFAKLQQNENIGNYRKLGGAFYMGVLLYGGLNLSAKSIVKYYNENDKKRKDKYNIDEVNDIMYGLEFNFGYRSYHFYIRKDLNDYFHQTNFTVNQGIEFGIRAGF